MVAALNAKLISKDALDEASYVARAGGERDGIIETLRAELRKKFPADAAPKLLPASIPPGQFLAYAYLAKDLAFATPFPRVRYPVTFQGVHVVCFGASPHDETSPWSAQRKQVSILDHRSKDDFIVELITRDDRERLLLARVAAERTLERTVAEVLGRVALAKPSILEGDDELVIPVVGFDLRREYAEIVGKRVLNPRLSGRTIDYAIQDIRFNLNERGASLKSEAAIGSLADGKPKRLIFDGPFLVLLMRKTAKMPYFALWIENAELLTPSPGR